MTSRASGQCGVRCLPPPSGAAGPSLLSSRTECRPLPLSAETGVASRGPCHPNVAVRPPSPAPSPGPSARPLQALLTPLIPLSPPQSRSSVAAAAAAATESSIPAGAAWNSEARRGARGSRGLQPPGRTTPAPSRRSAPSPAQRPATVPRPPPPRASPASAAAQRPEPPPPPSSAATTIITSPAAPLTLTLPTAAQPLSAPPPLAEAETAPPPMGAGLKVDAAGHWQILVPVTRAPPLAREVFFPAVEPSGSTLLF